MAGIIIAPERRAYGAGLRRTTVNLDPNDLAVFGELVEGLGLSVSQALRQLIRRTIETTGQEE